ncbi:pentapeptide repeat-containing protein [Phenylobacterium immobile]|uniref:pentapeptide repeat-containing protein n=1 Tax=Phenylobacterium immobile TaxID=21 RepID=UPI001C401001|nr:pentapeptide repeat-containing protein [Phenylobacterium immobile]
MLLLITCGAITLIWGVADGEDPGQLWPELGGMTLDVFVILVVYEAFAQRRARTESIERQLETIDDYKRWDAEEARLRIAGALRRLAALSVSKVAFAGLRLSDFDFAEHGIRSLAGSTFYDGDWGNPHNVSGIRMQRVDLSHLDCSRVEFSPFEPLEILDSETKPLSRYANFLDCAFRETNLRGATFNGAELRWTQAPPADHFEWEEDDNGEPFSIPVSEGPFHNADLQGAGFRGCRLVNADFRGADNLEGADFFGAKGLETAVFDNAAIREAVMASAHPPDTSP